MTDWLGIDVGYVFPAADSDGNVYEWTRRRRPTAHIAAAGPVKIRKANGVTVTRDPYTPSEAATVLARTDHTAILGIAAKIVGHARHTERGVALEDWSSFLRRKKAWVDVYKAVAARAEQQRVPVVQVNRAYTSITCPRCDWRSRANRPTRGQFVCTLCGFSGHADVVAAINIARRAAGTFNTTTGHCAAPGCSELAWKASLCRSCYRFKRAHGQAPTRAQVTMRREAPSQKAYRDQMRKLALVERTERRDREIRERMNESYRTHDAWGNPLPEVLDESQACN